MKGKLQLAALWTATAASLSAQTLTTLHNFCSQSAACADGELPRSALLPAPDGNFYGTTYSGGANESGTIFEITPSGQLTTIYNFCSIGFQTPGNCADGAGPVGALVLATDGNFYGTTSAGGPNGDCGYGEYHSGCGTIFRLTPPGALTTIYNFCSQGGVGCSDGAEPVAALIQGTDGYLYGTTSAGGGGIFRITPDGAMTTLFETGSQAALVESSGRFYGTSENGGINGYGSVFSFTASGRLTTLYSFCSETGCSDGANPEGTLAIGPNGNLYGTTAGGGMGPTYPCGDNNGCGTVFMITPGGALNTLYRFCAQDGASCPDGAWPMAGLFYAADGNFYGSTAGGGAFSGGTIFKLSPSGTVATLYNFCSQGSINCTDGNYPVAALAQGASGILYGSTELGGAGNDCAYATTACGTIFSLSQDATTQPFINPGGVVSASSFGEFSAIAPGSWIEIYGTNLATDSRTWTASDFDGPDAPFSLDGTGVTIAGLPAFVSFISPGQVNAQIPFGIPTGSQPLLITTPIGVSNIDLVTVNALEPGLLAPRAFMIGGNQYTAALFPDYSSFAIPAGAIPNLTSHPAQPGDTLILYGIGFGEVSPVTPAGELVPTLNALNAPFQLFIGGVAADVSYAGLAPDAVGLYQFNVEIPDVPANNLTPLTFTLAGNSGTQTLYIAVQAKI